MSETKPTQYLSAMGYSTDPEALARALIENLPDEKIREIIYNARNKDSLMGIITIRKDAKFYPYIFERSYCNTECLMAMFRVISKKLPCFWEPIHFDVLASICAHKNMNADLFKEICRWCEGSSERHYLTALEGRASSPYISSEELVALWKEHPVNNYRLHDLILKNRNLTREDALKLQYARRRTNPTRSE